MMDQQISVRLMATATAWMYDLNTVISNLDYAQSIDINEDGSIYIAGQIIDNDNDTAVLALLVCSLNCSLKYHSY